MDWCSWAGLCERLSACKHPDHGGHLRFSAPSQLSANIYTGAATLTALNKQYSHLA